MRAGLRRRSEEKGKAGGKKVEVTEGDLCEREERDERDFHWIPKVRENIFIEFGQFVISGRVLERVLLRLQRWSKENKREKNIT